MPAGTACNPVLYLICNPGFTAQRRQMRPTIKVALLGVVLAAYDQCDRPVAQWVGLNQVRRPNERQV